MVKKVIGESARYQMRDRDALSEITPLNTVQFLRKGEHAEGGFI